MNAPPPTTDLAERYGAPAPWRRTALVTGIAVLAVVFVGWVAWAAWSHGTPTVESELAAYDVTGEHAATAVVEVSVDDDADASCRVRALAEDHSIVGELAFTPTDGRNDVEVRTERRATSVELIGCTTPDQQRPR
ncbi:DUF4307 domain-containing protein [Nocardioides sp. Soil805]|uniref:DUF4307 domain-containing protein n=1 Tax=Nocardioides sp. Soil805 TaxID=1736416 RepID=UPI000702F254|nr:DUF4307 domain-containing protein [Nocardioides sp. Soil805]KRF36802.1 hypothetical protein ASG94_05170 [Nocardioides sp. Soil805]